ncbi:DNA recombination protein RmuC [Actinomycetaceae bacterium TAE3-ERU4]|nr:DNA recombination protein RmuC [Actinomycetaceae bacterium TAE3-ERU4]
MNWTALLTFLLGLTLGLSIALLYLRRSGEGASSLPTSAQEINLHADLGALNQTLQNLQSNVLQLGSMTSKNLGSLGRQLQSAASSDAQLLEATRSLKSALTSTTARGAWGELELRRLVEAAGMIAHVDFQTQKSLDSRSRPDLLVNLPEGGCIPLDAKVPLGAYLRACENSDSTLAKQEMRNHALAVRTHVRELARRSYHTQLPNSLGFTLMFLPLEPLLSAALEEMPDLLETALQSNIYIVTPTSLLATLRASSQIWVLAKTEDDAREVVELGRDLASRLATMTGHLEKVGSSLQTALKSYNQTIGSLENRVLPQIRKINATAEIKPLKYVTENDRREITSPELHQQSPTQ